MAKNGQYSKMGKAVAAKDRERSGGQIPSSATKLKESSDDKVPVFSFEHLCDNSFLLHDLGKAELKELHSFFKECSKLQWKEVRPTYTYKTIGRSGLSCKVPKSVPDDVNIAEMRVTIEHRIFGFRSGEVFNVIWFDPTHDVCPEGKKKKIR